MSKTRLEAFSDGVIAILITIMVLELKTPDGAGWSALLSMQSVFLAYVLSFIFLGIYWNNHHHMLHAAQKVNGKVLWANLHLLFWLSLVPFVTRWMGQTHVAPAPTAVYGIVLVACGAAYTILQTALIGANGADSPLARAVGHDLKGKLSIVFYVAGIGITFVAPVVSAGFYAAVAAMWLIPDRRIEGAHDT
ncbi:MAG: TMEM175 family protein [Gemmatimonadaceae bacterium]